MKEIVQAWAIWSKGVLRDHQSVFDPGELKRSVLDLIFQLWIGPEHVSVLVIGEDDSLLLVGMSDDKHVIVSTILYPGKNSSLIEVIEDSLIFWSGPGKPFSGQENDHLVTLLSEVLHGKNESFD